MPLKSRYVWKVFTYHNHDTHNPRSQREYQIRRQIMPAVSQNKQKEQIRTSGESRAMLAHQLAELMNL